MKHGANHICRNTTTAACVPCVILSAEKFFTSHSGPGLQLERKTKLKYIVYLAVGHNIL